MYRCLEDTVLVSVIGSQKDVSSGGIIMPDKASNKPILATVVSVGPGRALENGKRFPSDLKVGSIVAFPQKSGDKLRLDGHEFICIPERYILLVVSEEDDEEIEEINNERCATGTPRDIGTCSTNQ
jgi:chaperonin GroES